MVKVEKYIEKLHKNVKKMEKLRIFVVSVVLGAVGSGNAKEICPKMCTCDIFEGYRRADCSDQNLATPYTNVAKSVEILNLSGNEITTIDNDCLKDYKDLIKLSFARNSIHTIDLFAFDSLEKLNYLDLSDNRLEVIDGRILEENKKLTFLDLSKNKFMLVEDKPLIISTSLEFLSLQNSHLSHVYDSFFRELPNLVDLDISNNLLITLQSSAFEPLESLQFINLEYNRFSCDFRIENTLQMFKQRKVHVKIDKCVKNSKKPMFEKMILHPDLTTEAPREDIEIDLIWGLATSFDRTEFENQDSNGNLSYKDYYVKIKGEQDEEFDCDDDEMFPSTCECHQNFIKFYEYSERVRVSQKKSAEMRIALIFYLGIFFGVMAGCLLFFLLSLIRKRCAKANQKQIERQKARDQVIMTSLLSGDHSLEHSPEPTNRNLNSIRDPEIERLIPSRSPIPTPRNLQIRPVESSPSVQRRNEIVSSIQKRFDIPNEVRSSTGVSPEIFPINNGNSVQGNLIQRESSAESRNRGEISAAATRRLTEATPETRRRLELTPSTRRLQQPSPEVRRRTEPSPEVRRRTEPSRVRNYLQPQTSRLRVEPSPTALLIHKLFRNRDPRLLPDPVEISSLTPTSSRRAPTRVPELHIEEETVYSEIPTAPIPTEADDDSGSEYLSIDNLSLNLNFDSIRNESVTPPPAYHTIIDDEK